MLFYCQSGVFCLFVLFCFVISLPFFSSLPFSGKLLEKISMKLTSETKAIDVVGKLASLACFKDNT